MSAGPDEQAPLVGDAEPLLRIGELARRTGVAATTLRTWERRHGLVPSGRTPGNQRLYPVSAVDAVRRVQRLHAEGAPLSEIARATTAAPGATAALTRPAQPVPPVQQQRSQLEQYRARLSQLVAERHALVAERHALVGRRDELVRARPRRQDGPSTRAVRGGGEQDPGPG